MKIKKIIISIFLSIMFIYVFHNLYSIGNKNYERIRFEIKEKIINSEQYVDFTSKEFDAETWNKEDMLSVLGDKIYKNGNSTIKFDSSDEMVIINSDVGNYKGKKKCKVYGKFKFDFLTDSSECLYIMKMPKSVGILLIDNKKIYNNDQIPDLDVCIPLKGYSPYIIEVSPILNGYIAMPSGTYWLEQ